MFRFIKDLCNIIGFMIWEAAIRTKDLMSDIRHEFKVRKHG